MSFPVLTSQMELGLFAGLPIGSEGYADPLAAFLAGAYARGMADALELAGVAAVFMDTQGMVLHVGAAASALFGPTLRLEYDHLVGDDAGSTCAIQNLVLGALADGPLPASLRLVQGGQGSLILRARRVPGAAGNCNQLLKVLILIEVSSKSEAPMDAVLAAFEGRRGIRET
jgi:hypothetical protein